MPTDPPPPAGPRRGARTTRHRGRMSPGRRATLDVIGPRWTVPVDLAVAPGGLDAAFGRAAPRLVDIGGGNGEAARAWAVDHPDHDVVAVELHLPGLARMVAALDTEGPANVRVVEADALHLLEHWPPGLAAQVRVLFPDPWPKRRHVSRRLVDPAFVARATDLLAPGGTLHLATDSDDYAAQMRGALATEPRLEPDPSAANGDRWRSARPERPVTTYERRGLDAGRSITDLVAHRRT